MLKTNNIGLIISKGCDGSILLDGADTEQKAPVNQLLAGFDLVNDIKEAVEKACPGVVSCTDVIVIATRSAISLVIKLILVHTTSNITIINFSIVM